MSSLQQRQGIGKQNEVGGPAPRFTLKIRIIHTTELLQIFLLCNVWLKVNQLKRMNDKEAVWSQINLNDISQWVVLLQKRKQVFNTSRCLHQARC